MIKSSNYSIGLTIFRVLICFIIIKNMCFFLPLADDFFGAHAMFPYAMYLEQMSFYGINFLTFPFHIPYAPQSYLIAVILLSTMYMLAIGKRYTGFLLFIAIIVLKIRNGFILDGSDNVIQVALPFLILADNMEHFRFSDKKNQAVSKLMQIVSSVALLGLMIQVCYVYLFTGLAKHEGELWQNGTAVYYTMRVRDFMATSWNIPLTENHYFVVIATYFTVFWELAFPFLVWFRKSKFFIFFGGIMLHVGIWFFMRIDNFSWVMLSTYFVFITNEEYGFITKWFKSNKLTVFIDGWCPNCIGFSRVITRMDFLNLIEIKNIRETNDSDINMQKALERMASKNWEDQFFYGFNSIVQIFKRLPVFWILLPFVYLLKIVRLGDYLYNELAIRRKIIPIHCTTNCIIHPK